MLFKLQFYIKTKMIGKYLPRTFEVKYYLERMRKIWIEHSENTGRNPLEINFLLSRMVKGILISKK